LGRSELQTEIELFVRASLFWKYTLHTTHEKFGGKSHRKIRTGGPKVLHVWPVIPTVVGCRTVILSKRHPKESVTDNLQFLEK